MTGEDGALPLGYRDPHYLGSGGWAQVFRCVDDSGAQVAVKLFHQRLDDPVADTEGFRRECQIAAGLSAHTGVVNLRAAGITAAARPWLAMDYAPNGTLADLIKRTAGAALPVHRALDLTISLADTLTWAHQLPSPVIHGDLKTANVLLDAEMRPLLSDFGVATHLGSKHSVTVAQFTQTHAAPEVLRDGRGSVASDIWALTATIYEMLTGAPPFVVQQGEGPGAFIERVQRGLPVDAIPASVPDVVARVIRGGLVVDRDRRIASMGEFAAALRSAQRNLGLPVTPVVPPPLPGAAADVPFTGYAQAILPTVLRPPRAATTVEADVVRPVRRRRKAAAIGLSLLAVVALVVWVGIGRHTPTLRTAASGATSGPARSPLPSASGAGPSASPTAVAPTSVRTTTVPAGGGVPSGEGGAGGGGGATVVLGPTTLTVVAALDDPLNGDPLNLTPFHNVRPVYVHVYSTANVLVYHSEKGAAQTPGTDRYLAMFTLPSGWKTGSYRVEIRLDYTLWKFVHGDPKIVDGAGTLLPLTAPIPGDVNQDGAVNPTDYNIIVACYSDGSPPTGPCDSAQRRGADINDDDAVNATDLNLYLRIKSATG